MSETVGRMTRSRAKAMGSTPLAAALAATPEPKTTTRKRGGKATPAPAQQKELQFDDVAPTTAPKQEKGQEPDVQAERSCDLVAERSVDQAPRAEPVEHAEACSPAAGSPNAVMHGEAHDESSVLMASPIVQAPAPQRDEDADGAIAPMPLDLGAADAGEAERADHTQQAAPSPLPAPSPAPQQPPASPLPLASPIDFAPQAGAADQASPAASPAPPLFGAPAASPLPAGTPLSFMSDAPMAPGASPAPVSMPGTPLSFTSSMVDAVNDAQFSPLPDEDADQQLAGSPISLAATPGAAEQPQAGGGDDAEMGEAVPLAGLTPAAQAAPMGSPRTYASDMRARATPAEPSPMAAMFAMAPDSAPQPAAQSRTSDAGFQGFAPLLNAAGTVACGAPQAESPSLEGLVPVSATAAAATSSPSPFSLTPAMPPLEQLQDLRFTPQPPMAATPVQGAATPQAATPAPEAAEAECVDDAHEALCEAVEALPAADMDAEMDGGEEEEEEAQEEEAGLEEPVAVPEAEAAADDDAMMAEEQPSEAVAAPVPEPTAASPAPAVAARTPAPSAAKTPVTAASRTPLAAPRSTLPASKPATAAKATPKAAATPAAAMPGAAKSPSPYMHVESRYKAASASAAKPRTPLAAAPSPAPAAAAASAVATTPVAPTTAAMGAKSAKRVSITTPATESARATAARQVVPTPYRPKSAVRSAAPASAEAAAQEAACPVAAAPVQEPAAQACEAANAAAEQRRAKAADRLKAIHDAEQAPAPVPGYLASTATFAGKATKVVKSKVEAAEYDPRSLRQLKREVKEAAAKKEKKALKAPTLADARETKLTPKVAERGPLPLVASDGEDSGAEEAAYDGATERVLVAAMSGLEVAPPKGAPAPLRGLPAPKGRHLRFNEKGDTTESPQRTMLRGLPVATGKYKRFA